MTNARIQDFLSYSDIRSHGIYIYIGDIYKGHI